MLAYRDIFDALGIMRRHRRICPDYPAWERFEHLLNALEVDTSGLPPLTPENFQQWSPMERICRLQRQLAYAKDASEIDRAVAFLEYLDEQEWVHLPPEPFAEDPLRP